ncbi:MAG: hypothetical protein LBT08_05990, partial [Synergistaceae bacterium]|nr:hypothetical protein [Synergistaceae bacterium]
IALAAVDQSKEPDGFRGMKWGEDRKNIYHLVFNSKEEGNGISDYYKDNEKNKIGSASLDYILYGFKNDKFCRVFIATRFKGNLDKIAQTLKEAYGEPSFERATSISWNFSNVRIFFHSGFGVLYEYKPTLNEAENSTNNTQEQEVNKKKEAIKGVEDL